MTERLPRRRRKVQVGDDPWEALSHEERYWCGSDVYCKRTRGKVAESGYLPAVFEGEYSDDAVTPVFVRRHAETGKRADRHLLSEDHPEYEPLSRAVVAAWVRAGGVFGDFSLTRDDPE